MLRFSAAAVAGLALAMPVWAAAPTPPPAPVKPAVAPVKPAVAPVTPAATPAKPAAAPAKPAAEAGKPSAQLWFISKAVDGAIGYDARSIKTNPELGTVKINSLVYLQAGLKSKNGATFHFILSEDTLDCIGPQFKPGARLIFDAQGKMLDAGEAPANAAWSPLTGNLPLAALRGVACTGATFKNINQANDFNAAMKMMKELK